MNQYHPRRWRRSEVSFDLVADVTDPPLVTVEVSTPIGRLGLLGFVEVVGRVAVVRRVDVQGPGLRLAGWANLRLIAELVMEGMDLDGLVIEGAARTSGTYPGRTPRPIRFAARRDHPASHG